MTSKDAYMFPITASCVLMGLYVVFKYINERYIDFLIKCYIVLLGTISSGFTIQRFIKPLFPKNEWERTFSIPFIPIINPKPKVEDGDKEPEPVSIYI